MENQIDLPEKISVTYGGYAQYFIYLPVLILLGIINAVLKIPPPYLYYLYMGIGVVAVMSMNSLQAMVFTKIIIKADKDGIWTSKLNNVPWKEIKDIRLEKIIAFTASPAHQTNQVMTELVIQTKDGRKSVFWGRFLNTDPNLLCTSLNNFLKVYK